MPMNGTKGTRPSDRGFDSPPAAESAIAARSSPPHDPRLEEICVSDTIGLDPATRIADVYRLIEPLGAGAMGAVMLAQDESLDRLVAIKFVRRDRFDLNFRLRFAGEARAMARVNHPNVVQIHAFGEHEGLPYFVMEFVDGITLETWIARNGPPTDLAVPMRIIEEICLGLSAIHAAATIHRDLTPTNILLDANGKPCITDMGLAVLRREGGRLPLETAGTPAYMAPEVAFSREVDPAHRPRSDVYSLACVAYELLTGRPPFRSDSEIKLMIQHAIAAVPRPSRINPAVPLEVDQAIVHALAKDPAARTPTPEAFWCEMSMGQRDPEPERILIAEDDGDSRDAIVGYLQRTFPDAEVEGVGNGFSALAAFDQKPPSIVLLDIRMPGLDGLQVTEWIRRREQWTRIPILIITGSGGPEQWEKLRELGADGFLVKPVSLDDVVALTRRSLRERRSRVSTAVVGSK